LTALPEEKADQLIHALEGLTNELRNTSKKSSVGKGTIPSFKIARDAEVKRLVDQRLDDGTMTQAEIIKECIEQFGERCAPSVASLSRYVRWLGNKDRAP